MHGEPFVPKTCPESRNHLFPPTNVPYPSEKLFASAIRRFTAEDPARNSSRHVTAVGRHTGGIIRKLFSVCIIMLRWRLGRVCPPPLLHPAAAQRHKFFFSPILEIPCIRELADWPEYIRGLLLARVICNHNTLITHRVGCRWIYGCCEWDRVCGCLFFFGTWDMPCFE